MGMLRNWNQIGTRRERSFSWLSKIGSEVEEMLKMHGFLHFSTTVHNLCPFPTEVITGFDQNSKTASVLCYLPVAVQIEDIPKHSLNSIVHYLWGVGWGTCIKPHWWFFCYIAPVQWTLSEVLVNQATGQGKWWGNLLKHQHWCLLWNMWISFQIEAIKWVLLLFDLPSAKVREHIHVLHVEGCIPSPFDLDSWRGHTMRTPKHGCMYVQTTDFCPFLRNYHGFWPQLKKTSVFVLLSRECSIETMLFI